MRILVAGGGIAGLAAALALTGKGRTVEVIERDPSPPYGGPNEIFEKWDRKGATQLRQSHAFHARIVQFIRTHHPELRQRLLNAGVYELKFADVLSPTQRRKYRPKPIDAEWGALTSRRSTLEAIMRAYAEERSGAIFHSGYKVRGIVCVPGRRRIATAKAFKVETPSGAEEIWEGDVLIDASGRNSSIPDWLEQFGVKPEMDEAPAGIIYCTRNYRVHPGQIQPSVSNGIVGGDFGFIRGALFPADIGNFSITISLPEIETKLIQAILSPDVFDNFARKMPGFADWLDPARSFATSKVYSIGNLKSVWRYWVKNDRPLILNFFAIGDSTTRTNPLYGRGCSLAMVHARVLADVLSRTKHPVARARRFDKKVYKELRPFYDAMVGQDQAAIKRAASAQNPDIKLSFREKVAKSFAEDAVMPAMRGSVTFMRAFMRSGHMLEPPNAWLKKPGVIAIILATWATPRRFKKHLYFAQGKLRRSELLAIVDEASRTQKAA